MIKVFPLVDTLRNGRIGRHDPQGVFVPVAYIALWLEWE